jgi:hypothetical protein
MYGAGEGRLPPLRANGHLRSSAAVTGHHQHSEARECLKNTPNFMKASAGKAISTGQELAVSGRSLSTAVSGHQWPLLVL